MGAFMYELLVHDQVTTFEERMEAVVAAKDLTGRPDMHVTANVTNGIETLSYRDGKLVAYTYETRRTEQRRAQRERSERSAAQTDQEGGDTEATGDEATAPAPAPAAAPAADEAATEE
jgi:hypothetical protein